MLNINNHYRNKNQKQWEAILHPSERLSSKSVQIINIGKDGEKKKHFTVSDNVNWCIYFVKPYGSFF